MFKQSIGRELSEIFHTCQDNFSHYYKAKIWKKKEMTQA
jgi:hypothetical protein